MYSSMSMRRAASIHELAMATPLPALMPPPSGLYGTLAHQPPPGQLMQLTSQPPTGDPRQFMIMGPPSILPPPSIMSHGRVRTTRSAGGSLPPMPPSSLLPPMQRRPLVVSSSGSGKTAQPEPLPVREAPPLPAKIPPSDAASKAMSKSSSKAFSYNSCCRGNVVVLWVSLAIIAFAVVMSIVFYYAFK